MYVLLLFQIRRGRDAAPRDMASISKRSMSNVWGGTVSHVGSQVPWHARSPVIAQDPHTTLLYFFSYIIITDVLDLVLNI